MEEKRSASLPEALAATVGVGDPADFGRTIIDPTLGSSLAGAAAGGPAAVVADATAVGRTTVLPRVEHLGADGPGLVLDANRARYEQLKMLGAGGMGEVALAQDNDIGRRVAVKRLLPEATRTDGLARFVEEIRTIGQLEHPNIVPIHDVGVDADGRYFFIMKYVDGETLESIIARLAAGDREAHARYTFEARIQIFMGLLRALEYAHSHGIVHRDLKPANVMVGKYGEVILMDWGVAKSVRGEREAAVAAPTPGPETSGAGRERLYTTRHGSLVGTPAYMSPEQARGRNDLIDERSDTYSAAVLFHELLFLEHYLGDKNTLAAMLHGVMEEEPGFLKWGMSRHKHQGPVPAELLHVVIRGMRKDPAQRWQSSREMLTGLEEILEGRVKVQCHITLTKRLARELGRFVDRHPQLSFASLVAIVAFAGVAGYRAIHAFGG